jgi:hypothetical protein
MPVELLKKWIDLNSADEPEFRSDQLVPPLVVFIIVPPEPQEKPVCAFTKKTELRF